MPAVMAQYVEKYKARHRDAPWESIVFVGVDNSTAGPSQKKKAAAREWFARIQPLFEEKVAERQLKES